MKTPILSFFVLCLIIVFAACSPSASGNTTAANSDTDTTAKVDPPKPAPVAAGGEAVKAAVEQLFDFAKKGDCAAMAPLLALRNSNTAEDWKRGLRYDMPKEKVMVDKQCAQLQVIMAGLKTYDYKEFAQETESEGEWNIWVLDMQYEDGSKEERAFAFLKNGNGYILGDIDG